MTGIFLSPSHSPEEIRVEILYVFYEGDSIFIVIFFLE